MKDCLISVICPGIRVHNWMKLYRSIELACSYPWEIIFVGPQDIPTEMKNTLRSEGKDNFVFIKDFGSPIRCQQIGLGLCVGEYVTWAADDGEFLPDALDIAYRKIKLSDEKNVVVMGKYYEGNNDGDIPMQETEYYLLSRHDASKLPYIKDDYLMLNVGLVKAKMLWDMGGWDCVNFEVCPMAYNDLAVRMQMHGVKFIVQDELMFKCSHLPGHAGDHGPIHDAQVYFDQPRFSSIYSCEDCKDRIVIDIDNWRRSPARWERRFGKEVPKVASDW